MALPHKPCRSSSIIFSGFAAGVTFWLSIAFGLAMDFGGGSFAKGFPQAVGYLPLFGIFLCLPAIFICMVAIIVSKLLGIRVTYALVACGSMAIMIHSAITSRPGTQLERLSNKTDIPHFNYLEFQKFPTFNDGTSYAWQIHCTPQEAQLLASKLQLQRIPEVEKMVVGAYSFSEPNSRVSAFKSIFEHAIPDEIHYADDTPFVGGFSEKEQLFRLARFPDGYLNPRGSPALASD